MPLEEGSSQVSIRTFCCSIKTSFLTYEAYFCNKKFPYWVNCTKLRTRILGACLWEKYPTERAPFTGGNKTEDVPVHKSTKALPNWRTLLLLIGFNQVRIFFGMLTNSLLSQPVKLVGLHLWMATISFLSWRWAVVTRIIQSAFLSDGSNFKCPILHSLSPCNPCVILALS